MNDLLYVGTLVLVFLIQLLCTRARKLAVKLFPIGSVLLLMILCVALYILGGGGNWGFLILLILLSGLLAAAILVWLLSGIVKVIQKLMK